jgi:uncharacterized coiled-coil DUF342 family protein
MQREAIARQEAATAKLGELDARWEILRQEYARRAEEGRERTDAIIAELQDQRGERRALIAELRDQRDERRALIEALLRLTDRLPPPPPHLKSA